MKPAEEFLKEESNNNNENLLLLLKEAGNLVAYYRRLLNRYELDSLTGLPGSNNFHDYTKEIGDRAENVGIIFFDVNDLKFYNDTKGHGAGDLLLQKAAESIIFISGGNTRAFRVGGDEFVAIIRDCNERDMDGIIIKWREKLTELNKVDDGINCSIAVGAAIGKPDDKIGDVLKLADERMYADKRRIKAGLI